MSSELKAGQHIVCQTCPARVGFGPSATCDTSKLDGKVRKQPLQCPLPRVVYGNGTSTENPYTLLRNQLGK